MPEMDARHVHYVGCHICSGAKAGEERDALRKQMDAAVVWVENLQGRVATLEAVIEHVLRYGKLGKQTERRLREAMGQSITDEINADPDEAEALRRAREQARRGDVTEEI